VVRKIGFYGTSMATMVLKEDEGGMESWRRGEG